MSRYLAAVWVGFVFGFFSGCLIILAIRGAAMIDRRLLKKYVGLYSQSQQAFHVEQFEDTVLSGIGVISGKAISDYIVVTPLCDTAEEASRYLADLQYAAEPKADPFECDVEAESCRHPNISIRPGKSGVNLVYCTACGKTVGFQSRAESFKVEVA